MPANAPVKQYWSATLYDRPRTPSSATCRRPSRSSQSPGLQKNADGSVDLYFGPKAPAARNRTGFRREPGGHFEVLFRLYGPDKAFFDKTWKLPDIEEAK